MDTKRSIFRRGPHWLGPHKLWKKTWSYVVPPTPALKPLFLHLRLHLDAGLVREIYDFTVSFLLVEFLQAILANRMWCDVTQSRNTGFVEVHLQFKTSPLLSLFLWLNEIKHSTDLVDGLFFQNYFSIFCTPPLFCMILHVKHLLPNGFPIT